LTERAPDEPTAVPVVEHEPRSVSRRQDGGFAVLGARSGPARVVPDGDGWRVEGDPAIEGWTLGRTASGLVVRDGEREVGRTMTAIGMAASGAPRHLLLEDGRLYSIVPRAPREGGLELTSWEVPGPYLEACPSPAGFTIAPTVACRGIADIRALVLLLAAEVADAERWLEPPTSR
jgi:hypothetical protein